MLSFVWQWCDYDHFFYYLEYRAFSHDVKTAILMF